MTDLATKGFYPDNRLGQELERNVAGAVGDLSQSIVFEGQFTPGQSVTNGPLVVRQAVSGTGQALSAGSGGINPLGTAIGLQAGIYLLVGSVYAQNSTGGELSLTVRLDGEQVASGSDDAAASTNRRLNFSRTLEVRTGESQLTFNTDANGLDVSSSESDHFFTIYKLRNG